MAETEPNRARFLRATQTMSAKLNILLLGTMVLIFALLGYLNVRLHRRHLEQNTLLAAERISDVIKQGTTDYMLRNDREGLYRSIQTMAREPGIEKIRIFDQEGRITYTTNSAEQNHVVDKTAEACYACHSQSQPLARLNRPDRFRIYRNVAGFAFSASSLPSRIRHRVRTQAVTRIRQNSRFLEFSTRICLSPRPTYNSPKAAGA